MADQVVILDLHRHVFAEHCELVKKLQLIFTPNDRPRTSVFIIGGRSNERL